MRRSNSLQELGDKSLQRPRSNSRISCSAKSKDNSSTGYYPRAWATGKVDALNSAELLHLATLGGAEAIAMDHVVGNFAVGKEFDALVVDLRNDGHAALDSVDKKAGLGNPILMASDWGEEDDPEDLLQKFLFVGDDRNIARIYVQGRRVDAWTRVPQG